jgi:hypothetical protein
MYAILFIGMKVDIKTFTHLIFLSPHDTTGHFQQNFNNPHIWKGLVSHKMYTNNLIFHKTMSIIRITFCDTQKPHTFPTKCT